MDRITTILFNILFLIRTKELALLPATSIFLLGESMVCAARQLVFGLRGGRNINGFACSPRRRALILSIL